MNRNSRKLLVPLATLAIATAVTVGSGATWTSTTSSTVDVTSGNILHGNSQGGQTLAVRNLKPGDVATGSLTITNTGSIDSKLSIQEKTPSNTFYGKGPDGVAGTTDDVSDLQLTVKRDSTVIYRGDFGGFAASGAYDITAGTPLTAAAGVNHSTLITFVVSLAANANDASQSQTAAATYTFSTTPVAGTGITSLWQ